MNRYTWRHHDGICQAVVIILVKYNLVVPVYGDIQIFIISGMKGSMDHYQIFRMQFVSRTGKYLVVALCCLLCRSVIHSAWLGRLTSTCPAVSNVSGYAGITILQRRAGLEYLTVATWGVRQGTMLTPLYACNKRKKLMWMSNYLTYHLVQSISTEPGILRSFLLDPHVYLGIGILCILSGITVTS